ncbi:DUF6279 family lipoprotein [Vibrio brasiliensis]|uniref:Putative lipoprotein n=1 Tax=Vibrio brasiliensis LMG 20546 TaxID=945543 RepID=E8LYD4_9VIBR|nr:DUF6279 family lipoprotein [Vibrio brasiliensis]EGA64222.1 putative lipoprotein [Vibrio brasiliensis LMG 20546]MCG9726786.1 DUF6279 family lipoprotein [Vibrio brasiliensis]
MKKLAILFAVCLALAGCSSKFVYNNMDWLLLEYLDDYVELNDEQEELVSQKIAVLSEWHRQEEIPNYVEHLDELMAIEPGTFTLQQLESQQLKFQQHSQRLVSRVAPELYSIARELSDDQVEQLMNSIRVRHTKYKKKYQPLSEPQVKQRYRERIEENLETWIGSLTNQQQTLLDDWVGELYVTSHDWIDHQTKMRIEMNALLTNRLDINKFQPEFNNLMFNPNSFYAPELEQKIDHNKQVANQYLVKVINSMTNKQTEHYREELLDWKVVALDIQ